jgi:hypothetical protein
MTGGRKTVGCDCFGLMKSLLLELEWRHGAWQAYSFVIAAVP